MREDFDKKPEYSESKEALQNEDLAQVWSNLVLEKEAVPADIDTFSDDELREWLYQSVQEEAGYLAYEWNLVSDEELLNNLRREDDPNKRAALELQYIQDCEQRFKKVKSQIEKSKDKSDESNKWDSWPSRMRQRGQFNCSGATLLGTYLLERAGIKSEVGAPFEHAVNVAYLSNGDTYYVDFMNGEIVNISQSEVTEIAGAKTLKIKDEKIAYELLPVFPKEYNAAILIDNLDSLKGDSASSKKPKSADERASLREAKEYMAQHKEQMISLDFNAWLVKLYKPFHDKSQTDDMKQEAERLKIIFHADRAGDYLKSFSPEEEEALAGEIRRQMEGIRKLMYEDNQQVLADVSATLRKFLEIYYQDMKKLRKESPELFRQRIERFFSQTKSIE